MILSGAKLWKILVKTVYSRPVLNDLLLVL